VHQVSPSQRLVKPQSNIPNRIRELLKLRNFRRFELRNPVLNSPKPLTAGVPKLAKKGVNEPPHHLGLEGIFKLVRSTDQKGSQRLKRVPERNAMRLPKVQALYEREPNAPRLIPKNL
jgi:hypothetical protein